jgi:hypothetical protein
MTPKYHGKHTDGETMIYTMGACRILLSGPTERDLIGWHFSISCADRLPTWEEQKSARYSLIPDEVTMVAILPPKAEYVNAHPFCLHWWEADPQSLRRPASRIIIPA